MAGIIASLVGLLADEMSDSRAKDECDIPVVALEQLALNTPEPKP